MNDFDVIILKCKNFFSKFLGGLFCVKVGRYIFPSLLVRNFFFFHRGQLTSLLPNVIICLYVHV